MHPWEHDPHIITTHPDHPTPPTPPTPTNSNHAPARATRTNPARRSSASDAFHRASWASVVTPACSPPRPQTSSWASAHWISSNRTNQDSNAVSPPRHPTQPWVSRICSPPRDPQTLGDWRRRHPVPNSLGMDPQVAQILTQRRSAAAVRVAVLPTRNCHRPGHNPRRRRQARRRLLRVRGIPHMLLIIHDMHAKIAKRNRLRQRLAIIVAGHHPGSGRVFTLVRGGRPTKNSSVRFRHRRAPRRPPGHRPCPGIVPLRRESAEKVGHVDATRQLMKSRKNSTVVGTAPISHTRHACHAGMLTVRIYEQTNVRRRTKQTLGLIPR